MTWVSTTMLPQPWDLLSTTLTMHQHSLTEPLFTSCHNTIPRMRQLNVLFVTVALRETLPHGKTAQVSVSTRAGLGQRLRQCSHHGLLLTSKPQLAAALSGDRTQGKNSLLRKPDVAVSERSQTTEDEEL